MGRVTLRMKNLHQLKEFSKQNNPE